MTQQPDLSEILGEESQPIEFPGGLVGITEWQRFILITHPAGGALRLLKSLEEQRLSFIVTDPRQIDPNYQLSLSEADIRSLKYSGKPGKVPQNETRLAIYCILSIQEEPFKVTANLLGPLVINWQTGVGRQLVLSDSNYNPRYLIADHTSVQPSAEMQEKEGQEC